MIFVDSSFYLSALMPTDANRQKAIDLLHFIDPKTEKVITSYAVLGEVLTVGSQKYDKDKTSKFVQSILNDTTEVVLEKQELVDRTFEIFQTIRSKNVSWVDCYSFAIIERFKVEKALSFDSDFKKYAKAKILA